MHKYLQVFKISFQHEFAYRMNFIMWRLRNVLQIFIVFFLWDTLFSDPGRELFGYNRQTILTYVFGLIIIRSLVLSSRVIDVAGEVSRGELSNYLIKPVNYFRYWLARDLSSKFLNIVFAIIESAILLILLRPPFYIQTNPFYLFLFLVATLIAIYIYFNLVFIVSAVPFWAPENAWGAHFLLIIIVEFLSGALFPIDILPGILDTILRLTPFPYLIFFPLEIYLGKLTIMETVSGIAVSLFWAFALTYLMKQVWLKGLKVYQAYGR